MNANNTHQQQQKQFRAAIKIMGEQQATTPTPAVTTVNKDVVTSTVSRQIPIVCPGHTRPLAELQFISMPDENNPTRTLLLSACHDRFPMVR